MPIYSGQCPMNHPSAGWSWTPPGDATSVKEELTGAAYDLGDEGEPTPLEGCPLCNGTGTYRVELPWHVRDALGHHRVPHVEGTDRYSYEAAAGIGDLVVGIDCNPFEKGDRSCITVMRRVGGQTPGEGYAYEVVGFRELRRDLVAERERARQQKIRKSYSDVHKVMGPIVHTDYVNDVDTMRSMTAKDAFETMGGGVERTQGENRSRLAFDVGRILDNHIEREGEGERVRVLRELGAYLRKWSPEAADRLESYSLTDMEVKKR